MQQIAPGSDERLLGFCVYCGGPPETKDHVPSKILLDNPFPENLPKVDACRDCNRSFAKDEEYWACLLEVVLVGTTEDTPEMRPKIRNILTKRPSIAARIKGQSVGNVTQPLWEPEFERVKNVVLKLARGHAAFDLSEPQLDERTSISVAPLMTMTDTERLEFEQIRGAGLWPEVGSRAMIRMAKSWQSPPGGWNVVQPHRYRYAVSFDPGVTVKIVMSEYLACEVQWDDLS